jgi:hypothetical protein
MVSDKVIAKICDALIGNHVSSPKDQGWPTFCTQFSLYFSYIKYIDKKFIRTS